MLASRLPLETAETDAPRTAVTTPNNTATNANAKAMPIRLVGEIHRLIDMDVSSLSLKCASGTNAAVVRATRIGACGRLTENRRRSAGPDYRSRTQLAARRRQAQSRRVVGGAHGASQGGEGPPPWTAAPCGHALR